MGELAGIVGAAVAVFAGTNVDDLAVLTVLFLSARAQGRPRRWQIWVGQYAGVGLLVAGAAVAALSLAAVPDRWIRLLGLIPIALGVKGLLSKESAGERSPAGGVVAVIGLTIANGADNLSVYTPMFRTIGLAASLVTALVFTIGVAAWCLAGSWLGGHPPAVDVMQRHGHWLVPLVFIAMGALILIGVF